MTRFAIVLLAGVSAVSLASAVQAADLIVDEPIAAGIVSVSGNWDGAYVGVFAGAGWGTVTDVDGVGLFDVIGGPTPTQDVSGWLLGANVGADFTLGGGIVAGVVADIAWSNISGTAPTTAAFPTDSTVNWVGSLRGNLGFDGGAFLPYLTGGLAVANVTLDDGAVTDSNTHIGWTVGAGVKFAVTNDMFVDLLYRYSDYGSQDYVLGAAGTAPVDLNTHTVQVGLNWRF